jgi:hypothetical protein
VIDAAVYRTERDLRLEHERRAGCLRLDRRRHHRQNHQQEYPRERAACLFAMLNLRRRSLFNRGRVSRGLITAEGLKQHSVEPKLAWLAKAVNPDRHALMPGRRLRAIGAEKPIPPRQVKAVIAVGFSAGD